MRATWRALPAWPYLPRPKQPNRFQAGWTETLDKLEDEIEKIGGRDVLVGVVFSDDTQYRLDGSPKASFKVKHAGAEVSFDVPTDSGPIGGSPVARRRVTFHTDAYDNLGANLRAIALGLEALRAVDRYGITSTGEQYAGFAMLPSGEPADRGRRIVEREGGIAAALHATHPDKGGDRADFEAVQAYRELVGDR